MSDFTPGLVSVVVPSLNRERFIGEALDSILMQPADKVECVVMDGGSTDGTIDILRSLGARIRWQSGADAGPAAAIEAGWKLCRGEIVTWLNADDSWKPGCVTTALDAFERDPSIDVLYGGCDAVDEAGRVRWYAPPREWDLYQSAVRCDPILYQPASFIRRRVLARVGPLFPDWCHDHDLWIRIDLAGGIFRPIASNMANIRVWPGDAHNQPHLMVPAVLRLVDRTFANPALPPQLSPLKRRAQSYAYLRCIRYLVVSKPSHWLTALSLLAKAVRTDPSNLSNLAGDTVRFARPIARDALHMIRSPSRG